MAKKSTDPGATAVAEPPAPPTGPVAAELRRSSHGSASPDLLARIAALEAENSRLRAGGADEAKEVQEYPRTMYRAVPVTDKNPKGYEVKPRVETPEAQAAWEKKGWRTSPPSGE